MTPQQWPSAFMFAVVVAVLGVLVFTGKVPDGVLCAVIGWLAPSPLSSKPTQEVKP